MADCPASTPMPVTAGVCGNTVTANGLRCVRCQVPSPCVYRDAMVYCAPTCSDRACGAGL